MREGLKERVEHMLAWMESLSNGGAWHAVAMVAALPGADDLLDLVNEVRPQLGGLGWAELGAILEVLAEVRNAHEGEEVARKVLIALGYAEEEHDEEYDEEYDDEEEE